MRRFGMLVTLGAALASAATTPALATTIMQSTLTCGVCGQESRHRLIGSTNTRGGPDLDLRPAEMMRSTMSHWLQKCPHCGFVSGHLDQAGEAEKEVVASAAYKQLAADAAYPPLGRVFLARALLDEKLGRPKAAAMRYLHAAWAADDAGPAAAAAECRRRAIIAIEAAQKAGESMGREPGTTEALLADLLRRTGRAQAAKEAVGRGLAVATQPTLRKVLEYERRLAESGDTDRHTVRQAVRAVLDEPVNTPAGTDK